MLRRYEQIERMMRFLKFSDNYMKEHGVSADIVKAHRDTIIRDIREDLKRINRNYVDPLGKSLLEGWRTYSDDNGETGYDFRILPVSNPNNWSDDEIREYIMCEVGYPPICSPYDCTGKRFTRWVSFNVQKCGIVMIHAWGLDI